MNTFAQVKSTWEESINPSSNYRQQNCILQKITAEAILGGSLYIVSVWSSLDHCKRFQRSQRAWQPKGNMYELRWCVSYLSGRKLFVRLMGKTQDLFSITGVPQGSYLGLLLFLFNIIDFPKAIENCTLNKYADDSGVHLVVLV